MSTSRTEWRRRGFLLAGALSLAALMAEAGLRLAGISFPVFSQPDPDRGWALRPGARGHYSVEGDARIEINRDGWRDRERRRAKRPGTLRVAVVGDSYVEALGIPADRTFWAVLERALAGAADGTAVEVLPFGVHGYSTAQELLSLRCCVWSYSPDVLLLAFHAGNDVSDNSPTLDRSGTRYARPYFTRTRDGFTVDRSFRRSWRYRAGRVAAPLVAHSRLLQVLNRAHNIGFYRRPAGPPVTGERVMNREFGLDAWIYRDSVNAEQAEAWRTTEALVAMMARETAARNARFGVVSISVPIQVYPDSMLRGRFAREIGVTELFGPGRRIVELGRREGFPVLDLAPGFQSYADSHSAFLHGGGSMPLGVGHWNPTGHRMAGEAIARWMGGWLRGE